MGRSTNKKRHYTGNINRDRPKFGVADALHSVKRRRLSEENVTEHPPRPTSSSMENTKDGEDGWQTVTSKSSRRRRTNRRGSSESVSTYPKLSFYDKSVQPIRIDQLRDLALYVLADGVAPNWVAIRNKTEIGKVVAVMLPGMDEEMLSRARHILNRSPHEKSSSSTKDEHGQEIRNGDPVAEQELEGEEDSSNMPASDSAIGDSFDWLLDNTIYVRAPGDSKYCRVHSPLQAMLQAPYVDSSEKTATKGNNDKTFKPIRTRITEFIHTPEELRDAEYPIHPMCFTSTEDASLETSRRQGSGQSAADGWVDSMVEHSIPVPPSDATSGHVDFITGGLQIYAIDCEMVLTSDEKSSLARVSVVAWPNGKVVLDRYVKPDLPIVNYFTQYSGITPEILEDVTTRLSDVQKEVSRLLTQSTVILGHSLESDLNALKMTHPFIVDTSIIFPHPRGLPLRSSLKYLANKHLKREIQLGGAAGHDSVEDAKAVLDLVKLKCEKGPRFGTTEANGEAIFKRLSRATGKGKVPRTSAIVEYGSSPERGLGKDATYAIGCQNDEEIVTGMIRAVKGDSDGKEIPAGGADFVWGRLRALEFGRGWANNSTTANTTIIDASNATDTNTSGSSINNGVPPISQPPSISLEKSPDPASALDATLLQTLNHIQTIRQSLPPTTLLILFSGTSDMQPVLHYHAIQAQYRKEFKVKKWDELSVRWTDVEEQALRKAAEQARRGWGWLGVV